MAKKQPPQGPASGYDPFAEADALYAQDAQRQPAQGPAFVLPDELPIFNKQDASLPEGDLPIFNQPGDVQAAPNAERPPVAPGTGARPPMEPGLTDPTNTLDAALGGALQAGFETKDFLLGEGGQKSGMRQAIEQGTKQVNEGSTLNTFVSGVSQFATGMLGAGKLMAGAKLIKGVGGAASALTATRAGAIAAESAKAASVGAVAFDPHAERLSNLIESQWPALSNPVTAFMQAKPGDSAALGRTKAAMESLGLDAAFIGLFAAGMRSFKALKGGSKAEQEAATKALEEADTAYRAGGEGNGGVAGAPDGTPMASPDGAPMPGKVAGEAVETPAPSMASSITDGPRVVHAEGEATASAEAPVPASGLADEAGQAPTSPPAQPKAATGEGLEVSGAGAAQGTPAATPIIEPLPQATLDAVFKATSADADALIQHGGWEAAVNAGHVFGQGGRIPWQKLSMSGDPARAVDALTARLAESRLAELNAAKGGEVVSDATLEGMVKARVALFDEDPAQVLGALKQAGDQASTLAANMEASFLVSQKAMQDAYGLAARIKLGALDEFGGSVEQGLEALKSLTAIAAQAHGSATSIMSNAGRSLRRMRGEFAIKPSDLAAMNSMDGARLADLLASTGGDPKLIARAIHPSLLSQVRDAASFLYVNNLLWGWRTHAVNMLSNVYMLGVRPMERIVGSFKFGGDAGAMMRAENLHQYAYMGTSLNDAWTAAVSTFTTGESLLLPRGTEALNIGAAVAQTPWKRWDNVPNVLHNVFLAGLPKALGLPTRALGAADELVKQTVYRSKVQAAAFTEGTQRGLEGEDLTAFIKTKLLDAFDEAGGGTNAAALQEANVATFQQDLLPGTFGSGVSNFVNNYPVARFVLPFVRTPTNVVRQGVKLTPGLNMAQREYREMISGKMGPEAQAQAIGQMAMGSLFMGLAGHLAYTGSITGGGPADPALMKQLEATGWKPYSFVIPDKQGGLTYVPYERFDPIAMPFGIIADLSQMLQAMEGDEAEHSPERSRFEKGATSLLMALGKQMGSKTYLMSIKQVADALMDPDRSLMRTSGQMAANLIPAASLWRNANPDPLMRDARGFVDQLMKSMPGFSEDLPARYDALGQPVTVRRGLWVTTPADKVDAELRRMALEEGLRFAPVSPTSGFHGADLRDITLADGKTNAFERYQQLSGQPTARAPKLKDLIARLMETKVYQRAPDGKADTRGTKQWILSGAVSRYRELAHKLMLRDPNVRDAVQRQARAVAGAYAKQAADGARPKQSQGGQQLEAIGKAFGFDLSPKN